MEDGFSADSPQDKKEKIEEKSKMKMNENIEGDKKRSKEIENNKENGLETDKAGTKNDSEIKVFQRYYHLFEKGELEGLFQKIESVRVIRNEFDHDNWYIVVEKI